jgi:putative Ig domain-containing protein/dockerin type I repeat protein
MSSSPRTKALFAALLLFGICNGALAYAQTMCSVAGVWNVDDSNPNPSPTDNTYVWTLNADGTGTFKLVDNSNDGGGCSGTYAVKYSLTGANTFTAQAAGGVCFQNWNTTMTIDATTCDTASGTWNQQGGNSGSWTWHRPNPLTIAASLPSGQVGVAYPPAGQPAQIVSGGTTPYTISATGLPPGLSINSIGAVTGTPSAGSSATYTIKVATVKDAVSQTAGPASVTILIVPAAIVFATSLQAGQVGLYYPATPVVSGGVPPYVVTASGVPPGLSINDQGFLSGRSTDTSAGQYTMIVSVEDSVGTAAGPASIPITISGAPPPPPFFSQSEKDDFERASEEWDLEAAFFQKLALNPACEELEFCAEFLEACAAAAETLATAEKLLTIDPIDPNYTEFARPQFTWPAPFSHQGVPRDIAELISRFRYNADAQLGYARVFYISFNRYEGAAAAGNSYWMEQQLLTAKLYGYKISTLQRAQLRLLSRLATELERLNVGEITVDAGTMQAYSAQIAKVGYPAAKISALQAAGLTASDIAILQGLAGSLTATSSFTYPASIADGALVRSIHSSRKTMEEFVADRNHDGKVDCADVDIVRAALGSRRGDTRYEIQADVNGDGIVDWRDIRFVIHQLPPGVGCSAESP